MAENKKKFLIATALVGTAALFSRVLGLLRSSLLAAYYGATQSEGLVDCYNASFTLPNIIYNIIVLGAVSIVLVPYFSTYVNKNDEALLNRKSAGIINFFFIAIALFSAVAWLIAPFFVKYLLVSGWNDPYKIALTVKLTRIMLLQPIFISLSGILAAYLNAKERYTSYSIAMLSYNIGIIAGIVCLTAPLGIEGVAWGTVLGSFLQFALQLAGALISGYRHRIVLPDFNREFLELFTIAIPRIIALGGEQFISFFIVYFASFIYAGAITIYNYAENFSMVPFGMVAVSVSTTAFPIFSKKYAAGDYDEMLHSLFDTLRMLVFLIVPITILMITLRQEIIDILLGYHKFTREDSLLTAASLRAYMTGIPFYSVTIVLVKYFYAQKKTLAPMVISLIMCSVTIGCWYLMAHMWQGRYGVAGLSAGRSAGYILQTGLLCFFLFFDGKKRRLYRAFPKAELAHIIKIIMINVLLAGFVLVLSQLFVPQYSGKLFSLVRVAVVGLGGVLFYLVAGAMIKLPEFEVLARKLRK